jgi:hypothetical protein
MMVWTTGRERTAAEFAALLADAGWHLDGVHPTGGALSLVEARA